MSFLRPWLCAVLVVAACFHARWNFPDPDTFWHLAVGEHILAERRLPESDIFSFTAQGKGWMATEWLGEVLMAQVARWGGPAAATVLLLIITAAFFLLLFAFARQRSSSAPAAFLACLAALPLSMTLLTLRPQLLGHCFLLILLLLLERFKQRCSKEVFFLPLLFLVWVNLHGSFALGLAILTGYLITGWLPEFRLGGVTTKPLDVYQRRRLVRVFLACLVVLPITPYGARLATYPFEVALFQPVNVSIVSEWQSMNFGFHWGQIFLAMVLMIVAAEALLRPEQRLEQFGLLLFAVLAASLHRRFALLFVLVFAPYLAALLARWIREPHTEGRSVLHALVATIAAAVVVIALAPSGAAIEREIAERYPAGAVRYIRQHHITTPMLNTYTWGGYLIWALGDEHKVFVDGRADLYEYAGVLSDYYDIRHLASTAPALLKRYGVEACLFDRESELATYLIAVGWKPVYHDEMSVLLLKPAPLPNGRGSD